MCQRLASSFLKKDRICGSILSDPTQATKRTENDCGLNDRVKFGVECL